MATALQAQELQPSPVFGELPKTPVLRENTVGVVKLDQARASPGYTLFSSGMENYLIDLDGQVMTAQMTCEK